MRPRTLIVIVIIVAAVAAVAYASHGDGSGALVTWLKKMHG